MASFGGEFADDEIFEIILESLKSADRVRARAASGNRPSYREVHSFEHPGYEMRCPEIGIDAGSPPSATRNVGPATAQ